MTSKFTMDFSDHTSQSLRSKPNLDRLPMPALLSHLNVRESEWTSIYDYAIGVVERAMAREEANKQLDTSKVVVSVFGSENKKRDDVKADNDKQTKKGWTVLLSKCNTILGGYGISSHLMVDPTTSKEYGVEFSCRVRVVAVVEKESEVSLGGDSASSATLLFVLVSIYISILVVNNSQECICYSIHRTRS